MEKVVYGIQSITMPETEVQLEHLSWTLKDE